MTDGALTLPARTIPIPDSLSPPARAYLAAATAQPVLPDPPPSDKDGWRRRIAAAGEAMTPRFQAFAEGFEGEVDTLPLGAAAMYRVTPAQRPGRLAEVAYFDIHGGALIMLGGEPCRLMAVGRARSLGAQVFSVDYRMAPDHPYPAALDDCLAGYREVLRHYPAANVVVGGSSAGGNLSAALMLRARDEGLPLPAGVMLMTPELDLTESGDSFEVNQHVDVTLRGRLTASIALYADGHDLAHPYLSPLFGDFAKGFPPTFLTAGTRDLFLSNAVRMHRALRRAGVPAELHIGEGMPHGGFFGAPEDAELEAEGRRFAHAAWGIR